MPLLQINASDDRLTSDGTMLLDRHLRRQLSALPKDAPIVVLVHGYSFSPFRRGRNPHTHILSCFPPDRRGILSWPRHLGFGRNSSDEGLCIAFGWHAWGHIWGAYRQARLAGHAFARLIELFHDLGCDRPIHVMAHSLGARVVLSGVAAAQYGKLGRVILMAGAEFQAAAALAATSTVGRRADIINIASRENDLFDLLIERLIHPFRRNRRTIGTGMAPGPANWLDIQIDNPASLRTFAEMGFRIGAPTRRVCHWSPYLRPGMFAFYSALIRQPDRLPLETLQSVMPAATDPRWSRLFPHLAYKHRLSLFSKMPRRSA